MTRVLGAIAFGIPAGLLLFAGIAYVVVMFVGHPTLFEEF